MKPKPKIRKKGGRWRLELPAYGFGKPHEITCATHREAVERMHVERWSTGGAFERRPAIDHWPEGEAIRS